MILNEKKSNEIYYSGTIDEYFTFDITLCGLDSFHFKVLSTTSGFDKHLRDFTVLDDLYAMFFRLTRERVEQIDGRYDTIFGYP